MTECSLTISLPDFLCLPCPERSRLDPSTSAPNNLQTAHNSGFVFAQIDAEFILYSNYLLLVMIRPIAFKLSQIKCTALVFKFLTVI